MSLSVPSFLYTNPILLSAATYPLPGFTLGLGQNTYYLCDVQSYGGTITLVLPDLSLPTSQGVVGRMFIFQAATVVRADGLAFRIAANGQPIYSIDFTADVPYSNPSNQIDLAYAGECISIHAFNNAWWILNNNYGY